MISSDQLHPDPSRPAGSYSLDRLRAWGVLHSLETQEGQVAIDVVMVKLLLPRSPLADGERQHTLALAGHHRNRLLDGRCVERPVLPVLIQLIRAALKNGLHRSLQQDALLAMQGGHVLLL